MPFLCSIRHRRPVERLNGPPSLKHSFPSNDIWQWSRTAVLTPFEIRHQPPCGVWNEPALGVNCRLFCDGFIARPRRIDAISGSPDLRWLAERFVRHGNAAVDELKGQFALCFVNDDTGELVAARDRLGARALYWYQNDDIAAVASRSSDLARLVSAAMEENPAFVSQIFALRGWHTPGSTPFQRVHEVLPGARLTLGSGGLQTTRPAFRAEPPDECRSADDWIALFRETFEGAVDDVLGEEERAGVMLSGGMDSIPVLVEASRSLYGGKSGLRAISWMLPDYPKSDESQWIESAARSAGVKLLRFDGGTLEPFSRLDSSLVSPDLPYFNPVRELLLNCHSLAADASCALQLAATQGDKLYPGRYRLIHDLIQRRDWVGLRGELAYLYQAGGWLGMYRDPAVRYPVSRVLNRMPGYRESAQQDWMTNYAVSYLPALEPWPPEAGGFPNPDHAYALLGPAMTFGPAQENEFSHRFGVERRDPFQNEALVALMLHAPVVLSHTQGQTKWIMREAMRNRIPDSLRLKRRTGLLTQFINSGYERNREDIARFLFDPERSDWQHYVRPEFVSEALSDGNTSPAGLMTVCGCIGYSLWREYWKEA